MSNIGTITQAAFYRGDANLAGGNTGVYKPDLSAFQRLADFSYYYNKDVFDQQQQQRKEAIDTLSDAMSVDWSSVGDKQREEVMQKYNDFVSYVRENPDAIRFESPKFKEYLQRKNELANVAKAGTQRTVEYKAAMAEINQLAKDDLTKQRMLDDLNGRMKSQSIFTPIDGVAKYQATPINIEGIRSKGQFVTIGGDDNLTTKYDVYDFNGNKNKAISMRYLLESSNLGGAEANLKQQADVFNKIVQENIGADGKLNPQIMKNPAIGSILQLVDQYNNSVLKTGQVVPGSKKTVAELIGGMPDQINVNDGLQPEELLQLMMFANAGPDAIETTVVHTGEASQNQRAREQNATALAQTRMTTEAQKEAARIRTTATGGPASDPNLAWDVLMQDYEGKKGTADAEGYIPLGGVDSFMQQVILSKFPDSDGVADGYLVRKEGDNIAIYSVDRRGNKKIAGTYARNTFNKAYGDYQAKINSGKENQAGLSPNQEDPYEQYRF